MTSIIKFQPLSGVWGETPPCYILQIDEFRFLLDCGWDDRLGLAYLDELKKQITKIDAVLLSYPDLLHLGGLPTLVGRLGLSCPIYATVPVHKMGQMFLYDYYISRQNEQDFKTEAPSSSWDLDDVDLAFDSITQLKYNQSCNLTGKGFGLTISPLSAGHMLGGTVWKIMKIGEEDIYYAVDYNHKKERHLNGTELDKIHKPSLLIMDAYNANYVQARRRTRDEQLLAGILHTVRNGGNVLIAVDTAGRVLELAHMLDQLWRSKESGLHPYSLALLNNLAYNVIEFAKSQIEWMSDKLMRSFEGARNNPFQFKHLNICHNLSDLQKVTGPKVVLASHPDLEFGFARELFMNWCQDKKNCIILTSRPSEGTLGRVLIDAAISNPTSSGGIGIIELEVRKRVELKGKELESYYRAQREEEYARVKKEKEFKKSSFLKISLGGSSFIGLDDEDSSDTSEDEDGDIKMIGIFQGTSRVNHDLFIKAGMECKIESGSLFKAAKSKYPMYPHIEEKIRFDDYGEFIRQENYFLIDNVYEKEAVQKSYGGGGGGMGRGRGKYMQNNNDHHSQHHSHSQHQGGILTSTASAATEIEIQLPTKCISHLQKFDVQASIVWIDFEGRSDGESIQKILEIMKPRRLIITRGAEEAVRNLRSVAQVVTPETSIYSPSLREILDVTTESCIYQLKLKDALVSSLEFQKGKDAELAWVEGWLVMESELATAQEKKQQQQKTPALMETDGNQDIVETDDSNDDNLFPVLEPMLTDPSPHGTVFVNEIKLSDFKQVLARQGMSSEFSGGVLWCAGGTIALRRQDAGRLTVEGSLSDDFYRIRTLLYDQYAII